MVEGLTCFRVDISQCLRGAFAPLFVLFDLGIFSLKIIGFSFEETIQG